MKRRLCGVFLCLVCLLLCSGCWNYRGLDTIDIVTGVAVDRDAETGEYLLTFELVDTQGDGDKGEVQAKYVESRGLTLFDSIRNAKMRLINRLYGGNMQCLIISKDIAETEGLLSVLEEFLRDGEPRETMSIAISQQETAKEILHGKGIDSHIISYELHDMIREDNEVTASTKNTPLYMAYNAIKGEGNSLALPAVRCIQNEGETVVEVNGIALFREDRLIGFESAADTMQYLFVVDDVDGGVISFAVTNPSDSVSLEIKSCSSKTQVAYENEQLIIQIQIDVRMNVMEIKSHFNISNSKERRALERRVEEVIQEQVTKFVQRVQQEYKTDVLGLGGMMYRENPSLWRSLRGDWDTVFQNAGIQVAVQADVVSSGVLKNY